MANVLGYSIGTTTAKTVSAATFIMVIGWIVNAYHTGDWSMNEAVQAAFTVIGTAAAAALYTLIKNVVREKFGVNLPPFLH